MHKYTMWMTLSAAFLTAQGCHHCDPRPCPPAGAEAAYGPSRFFHPLAPRAVVAAPPPGAVVWPPGTTPPAPGAIVPVQPVPGAIVPTQPAVPAPDVRNYISPVETLPPGWRPAPEASERLVPNATPRETPQPPVTALPEERPGTPAMPVGIPQFRLIKKSVASGLRPTHLEGLDWLKNNGYRTALYVRVPGDSDDADRKQFEDKLGMKFASLALSPETLTLDVVDQFNAIVSDPTSRPVFVYDKDGSLAGTLWYLHFRMIDQQSDEDARALAARIGLKEEHRDLWLAIQQILGGKR